MTNLVSDTWPPAAIAIKGDNAVKIHLVPFNIEIRKLRVGYLGQVAENSSLTYFSLDHISRRSLHTKPSKSDASFTFTYSDPLRCSQATIAIDIVDKEQDGTDYQYGKK